ncbi:MAG: hypothetical protein GX805_05010, partial [Gammaproteobacteria bacterium]|nr:hypothetical protein [Gammaproteobacteria bacterium]
HHADKPSLYAGLPEDPKISPVVSGWKGPAKEVGLVAAGVALAGAALHGLVSRANKVSAEEEEQAQQLVDSSDASGRPTPGAAIASIPQPATTSSPRGRWWSTATEGSPGPTTG